MEVPQLGLWRCVDSSQLAAPPSPSTHPHCWSPIARSSGSLGWILKQPQDGRALTPCATRPETPFVLPPDGGVETSQTKQRLASAPQPQRSCPVLFYLRIFWGRREPLAQGTSQTPGNTCQTLRVAI